MVKGNISITPRNLALSLWWSEEWSPSDGQASQVAQQ